MVFVCNLRSIHSLANVVILFAIKTCQPCHYIKPIARVYTRECHENKNTRFWATYGLPHIMSMFTSDAIAAKVYFKNIKNILSFQLLASAAVSALFDIVRCIPRYCCFKPKIESCRLKFSGAFFAQ